MSATDLKLPKKLKIVSMDYSVESMKHVDVVSSNEIGQSDSNKKILRIDLDWGKQAQAQVFLHEILHAITHEMGINDNMRDEEKVVEKFSLGLCCVMRDNPRLFPLIQKALK